MGRDRRLRQSAASIACSLLLFSSCRTDVPTTTAIILEVSSTAAIDCVFVTVGPEGGPTESAKVPVESWVSAFDGESVRIAVYPGGDLEGELIATAEGRRGGQPCDGPVVAETAEVTRVAFVEHEVVEAQMVVTVLGVDGDQDGWANTEDCDDGDPSIHPFAVETCGDGVDQACAGAPDLGCPCSPAGQIRDCYPLGLGHPSLLPATAVCTVGVQRCERGIWSGCVGAVTPTQESCDGIDTDCDGTVDPGFCPCLEFETRPCYTQGDPVLGGVGVCTLGTQTCDATGSFGPCVGDQPPRPEVCDGLDNDCDGQTDDPDEIPSLPCAENRGVCGLASQPCGTGGTVACTEQDFTNAAGAAYEPVEISCDGLDNDCDGRLDETCPCTQAVEPDRACYPFGFGMIDTTLGVGPCVAGVQPCLTVDQWGTCAGFVVPATEICDGIDNDCDGITDNVVWLGDPCSASTAVGLCAQGSLICDPLVPPDGQVCDPGLPVDPDPACDGFDTNCNSTNVPADDDRDADCGAGTQLCCTRQCRDIRSDPNNCGDCDVICPDDGASCHDPSCQNGICTYDNWPNLSPCATDNNDCTTDHCSSGQCVHPPLPDGVTACSDNGGTICEAGTCVFKCFIAGTIGDQGVENNSEECEACRPGLNVNDWSAKVNGVSCASDSNPCTADTCQAGTCDHSAVPNGQSCAAARVCDGGVCRQGCWIANTFVLNNTVNPSNECESCQASVDKTDWSPLSTAIACDDGLFCTVNDQCDGSGGCQGGGPRDCSGLDTACEVGVCDEGTGQCVVQDLTIGTSCTAVGPLPGVCDGNGTCLNSCYIGGILYTAGTQDPGNPCRNCEPGSSRTLWTNTSDLTRVCNDGLVCTQGDTCDGAGGCSGGPPPDCSAFDDPCNVGVCAEPTDCEASPLAGGTLCGGNLICDGGGTCANGCWIANTFYSNGTENPAAECQACDTVFSITGWTNKPDNVTACTADAQECTDDVCVTGSCEHLFRLDGTPCGSNGMQCDTGVCACPGGNDESTATSISSEPVCGDGADNDCDGDVDCGDSDCDGEACRNTPSRSCSAGSCL